MILLLFHCIDDIIGIKPMPWRGWPMIWQWRLAAIIDIIIDIDHYYWYYAYAIMPAKWRSQWRPMLLMTVLLTNGVMATNGVTMMILVCIDLCVCYWWRIDINAAKWRVMWRLTMAIIDVLPVTVTMYYYYDDIIIDVLLLLMTSIVIVIDTRYYDMTCDNVWPSKY